MKNLLKILPFALLSLTLFSCDKDDDETCVCYEVYQPVCGDDGVEYANSCKADCAGVAYTEGVCPLMTSAKVQDLGDPALDGCGWVLEFLVDGTNQIHRADVLPEEYKIHDLTVQLTYQPTLETSICGLIDMIPVIHVVTIVE